MVVRNDLAPDVRLSPQPVAELEQERLSFPALTQRLLGLVPRGDVLEQHGHLAPLDRIDAEGGQLQVTPGPVELAALPEQIRGFGPVKEASIKVAKADEAKLWTAWEAA